MLTIRRKFKGTDFCRSKPICNLAKSRCGLRIAGKARSRSIGSRAAWPIDVTLEVSWLARHRHWLVFPAALRRQERRAHQLPKVVVRPTHHQGCRSIASVGVLVPTPIPTRAASRNPVKPNPSFKRTPNGVSRWPSSAGPTAHFALAVQRATP
jgi:hypothetical protein